MEKGFTRRYRWASNLCPNSNKRVNACPDSAPNPWGIAVAFESTSERRTVVPNQKGCSGVDRTISHQVQNAQLTTQVPCGSTAAA